MRSDGHRADELIFIYFQDMKNISLSLFLAKENKKNEKHFGIFRDYHSWYIYGASLQKQSKIPKAIYYAKRHIITSHFDGKTYAV